VRDGWYAQQVYDRRLRWRLICRRFEVTLSRPHIGFEPMFHKETSLHTVDLTSKSPATRRVVNPKRKHKRYNTLRSLLVPVDLCQLATLRFQGPERLIKLSGRLLDTLSWSLSNLSNQGRITIKNVGSQLRQVSKR
jgi:hypothetical protein